MLSLASSRTRARLPAKTPLYTVYLLRVPLLLTFHNHCEDANRVLVCFTLSLEVSNEIIPIPFATNLLFAEFENNIFRIHIFGEQRPGYGSGGL